jgi:hypothetical protein
VFPNDENIKRVKEDEKALAAWLVFRVQRVHKGDLSVGQRVAHRFLRNCCSTRCGRCPISRAGSRKGRASGFNFGFDRYLGESVTLPSADQVDRLTRQLFLIETICKELYACQDRLARWGGP